MFVAAQTIACAFAEINRTLVGYIGCESRSAVRRRDVRDFIRSFHGLVHTVRIAFGADLQPCHDDWEQPEKHRTNSLAVGIEGRVSKDTACETVRCVSELQSLLTCERVHHSKEICNHNPQNRRNCCD
jgi:hypothetical protein